MKKDYSKYLKKQKCTIFLFHGVIGNHNNILFGSGAAFWLSRDNILFILEILNN